MIQGSVRKYCYTLILLTTFVGSVACIFFIPCLYVHKSAFKALVKRAKPADTQDIYFTIEEFSEIRWIEEDLEFEWQGKLYDVKQIDKTDTGYRVYCKNDKWEEHFLALFDLTKGLLAHRNGNTKQFHQPQFCIGLYGIGDHSMISIPGKGTVYLFHYLSPDTPEPFTPPEIFSPEFIA